MKSNKFETRHIKPLKNGGWRNYMLGVVAELGCFR